MRTFQPVFVWHWMELESDIVEALVAASWGGFISWVDGNWRWVMMCLLKPSHHREMVTSLRGLLRLPWSSCHFLKIFFSIYLLLCTQCLSACMFAGQKRAPDLIIDGCESQCSCWELNSAPLREQPVFLATEPSLQPLVLPSSVTGLCIDVTSEKKTMFTGDACPPTLW